MNHQRIIWIEFTVGVFMLVAFLSAIFLALRVSGLVTMVGSETYQIRARFDNIGGLKVRSPVNIAGVTVGRVSDIQFDAKTFDAVVSMEIDNQYKILPSDTSASILTSGLLGEKYINLEPGASETTLGSGGEIEATQSALILENLIGKFLTRGKEGD
ncbi:MAG: outer membrane lipid asymmetry maintenance protein MlaD [Gammaproteobacteria bacterium]|nr:outer membrane lipid asymmetry maintenance protein MlaD [Gammaproteobacteria bacterium]